MKQFKNIAFICAGLFIWTACNEMEQIDAPDLSVSTAKQTYKVGEEVVFELNGNPDILVFYSGEKGNEYTYASTDRIMPSALQVSFGTRYATQSSSNANQNCQLDQFHVLVSADLAFPENATNSDSIQSINNANWTTLTETGINQDGCTTQSAFSPSGQIDITHLVETGKPFHFAYKYINRPNTEYGRSRIWRFGSFSIASVSDAGKKSIATQTTAGWKLFQIGDSWRSGDSKIEASQVTLRGPVTNESEGQELWCISNGLYYEGDTNLGYDKGIGLKAVSDVSLTSYKYAFQTPGTYTVTFLAINSNIYDRKETVKEISITIEE